MIKHIPITLIVFRLALAPIILGLVYFLREESRLVVIILMYLGLFSDIFDGIIARELNVSSQKLRRFDSQTDMIFWVSIGVSTWLLYPDLIRSNKVPDHHHLCNGRDVLPDQYNKIRKGNLYSCIFI
jgi:hypothetical protein